MSVLFCFVLFCFVLFLKNKLLINKNIPLAESKRVNV
jgi:hypothetical protein